MAKQKVVGKTRKEYDKNTHIKNKLKSLVTQLKLLGFFQQGLFGF